MQLALVNLWVGPGVGSFPGSDAQKNQAGSECLRAGLGLHVSSSTWKRKCTCTFDLSWIKTIRPWCFIQLFLITLHTYITDIYMYTYPHDPPPQHWWDYMWYVGLRTRCWLASDACPAKVTPTFAWRETIADVLAELLCLTLLTILTFTQLHLLALPLPVFLMLVLLLLPLPEPLRLLLQRLEVTLHVPHLLNMHLKLWGLGSSPP